MAACKVCVVYEQEQKELKQQKEAFVREKKLMQTVAVADNDIVNLSVGGTLMSTKRSTLTQVRHSQRRVCIPADHCLLSMTSIYA